MPTLREAVSQIRTSFKLLSSDNLISDRAIANELKSVASLLIKRELDKRLLYSSDSIFTELPCIQMEEVPLSQCCNYVSPCMIARSKETLPKIGENKYGLLTQYVASMDKKVMFKFSDPNRYVTLLQLYPGKQIEKYYWIQNEYLYITDPNIESVRLSAYFEEDVDFAIYTCADPAPCPTNPLDLEFKIPGYLLNNVLTMTRETLLKTYKQSKDDKTEDDMDTSA
jgi:hypothetical protein